MAGVLIAATSGDTLAADGYTSDDMGFRQEAVRLLRAFCVECHGPQAQEDEFRVDALTAAMTNRVNVSRWHEVVNVLNGHEMPPEDSKQLNLKLVAGVGRLGHSRDETSRAFNRSTDVVLRRLNRTEYKNTTRDLVGVDFDVSGFPGDAAAGGFNNNGVALSISPLQIELYWEAAQTILHDAIVTGY